MKEIHNKRVMFPSFEMVGRFSINTKEKTSLVNRWGFPYHYKFAIVVNLIDDYLSVSLSNETRENFKFHMVEEVGTFDDDGFESSKSETFRYMPYTKAEQLAILSIERMRDFVHLEPEHYNISDDFWKAIINELPNLLLISRVTMS